MTEEGHRQAVAELCTTRSRLILPDDIRAYAEIGFGIAFHLIAIGAQRRHGVHRESHVGLRNWLRDRGHTDAANSFEQLDNLRAGRWYGRQGNGRTAAEIDELLGQLEAWALADSGS